MYKRGNRRIRRVIFGPKKRRVIFVVFLDELLWCKMVVVFMLSLMNYCSVKWLLFSYLNNQIHCVRKREKENEEH